MPLLFSFVSNLERDKNKTKYMSFWAFWVHRQHSKESGRGVESFNKWLQKVFTYYPGVYDTLSYIFVDTPCWQSLKLFYLLDV